MTIYCMATKETARKVDVFYIRDLSSIKWKSFGKFLTLCFLTPQRTRDQNLVSYVHIGKLAI